MKPAFVIKIGGSLLYDNELQINKAFLFKLLKWYEKARKEYKHIVIVTGGGKISRHLTDQIKTIVPRDEILHRIGMEATRMNSEILRGFLNDEDIYIPKSLGDAFEYVLTEESGVLVTGGHKVGWSSDMDAAVFADVLGTKEFYKLSNIDYVYNEDPNVNPDALPIKDITWQKYMNDFGILPGMSQHTPGLSVPVGGFASQFCAQKGVTINLSGGASLEGDVALEDILGMGSKIHP
jgi:uridylate kinase